MVLSQIRSPYQRDLSPLTLEATDPSGKVDTDSVELTIRAPNSAPICEITQPNTGEFSVGGSTVTFAGTMSDVDIDANLLAVTWTSDKDGELSTGMADASGTYTFESSDMSLNTHQITMTVTDGWDYSARIPFNTLLELHQTSSCSSPMSIH